MSPELTAPTRERLPNDAFAYIDEEGGRHLPIYDEAHVRSAIARWNQTEFESKAASERARERILAAAREHGIKVSENDLVAHAAAG
jgi:uncharacterized protein DUF6582